MARYLGELIEGSRVDGVYVLRSREMRSTRNGDAYLSLELGDRTGTLPAVLFKPRSQATEVPAGSAVRVKGIVTRFRGIRRVSIDTLEPAAEWSAFELIGSSTRSQSELKQELRDLMRGVGEPALRRLLTTVFSEATFLEAFCSCPASQSHHHAYLSGLLEHTVSVASTCALMGRQYDGVDVDLLVTAGLLHDIGKVDELSFATGIGYTDEGRMVGHVVSTVLRVHRAAERAKVEGPVLLRLEHALLSHHGELEWGSPKRPSTFEALLLHHIDNLDAKAAGFAAMVKGASLLEESWTDSSNLFRRPLYAPRPVEDERPTRWTEDDQHYIRSA